MPSGLPSGARGETSKPSEPSVKCAQHARFRFYFSLEEYSQGDHPPEVMLLASLVARLALQARQVNQEGELLGGFQVLPVAA